MRGNRATTGCLLLHLIPSSQYLPPSDFIQVIETYKHTHLDKTAAFERTEVTQAETLLGLLLHLTGYFGQAGGRRAADNASILPSPKNSPSPSPGQDMAGKEQLQHGLFHRSILYLHRDISAHLSSAHAFSGWLAGCRASALAPPVYQRHGTWHVSSWGRLSNLGRKHREHTHMHDFSNVEGTGLWGSEACVSQLVLRLVAGSLEPCKRAHLHTAPLLKIHLQWHACLSRSVTFAGSGTL